jgi:hypothetical protein
VAGSVLHQGPAQISAGETPRLGEVADAIPDVHVRLEQFDRPTGVTEHRCRGWEDLHEAELARSSAGIAVVPAFDEGDRIRDVRWQALRFGLSGQLVEVEPTTGWSGIHNFDIVHGWGQGEFRKGLQRCRASLGALRRRSRGQEREGRAPDQQRCPATSNHPHVFPDAVLSQVTWVKSALKQPTGLRELGTT